MLRHTLERKSHWLKATLGYGTALLVLVAGLGFAFLLPAGARAAAGLPSMQGLPQAAFAPLERNRLDERPILVLDAGHGGHDPGAVSADGLVLEAEVNQQMVQRVMALLANHSDEIVVVQAHEPGTYATPMARTHTAVRLQAKLFISLHLNADTHTSTSGFQCLPTPPGRVYHQESEAFALLLAGEMRDAGFPVLGTTGVYYTYYIKTPTGYARETLDAAQVDVENPRRDESYGVVEYAGCPSVLAELWHISSPADMAACYSDEGMDRVADCVYRAVCTYFGIQPL